jgi:saccharopine dehydrogenase-like NADP-dependent oxidoreductase
VIAVLGAAGTIGRTVAGFLESWGAPCKRLDFRLEGDEHVDVTDAESLRAGLGGVRVVVNSVDYRFNLEVMRGALAAEADYVDLGGLFHMTRRQLGLDEAFRAAGRTAILGLGSAPGKTNLLARLAAERVGGRPVAMEIWAATRDPAAEGHPFPAPYSVRTLLDELSMRPMVVEDGRLRDTEPLSGRKSRLFPDPVGEKEGIYTLHSELATLPERYPTLEQASFRLCLAPGLIEKLLALPEGEEPKPYTQSSASVSAHVVEARNGDGRAVTGTSLTRGGSAKSTSEPPARAAVELLAGRISAPGVSPPESAIPDAEAFLVQLDTELSWS